MTHKSPCFGIVTKCLWILLLFVTQAESENVPAMPRFLSSNDNNLVLVSNPYEDVDWASVPQTKANLHAHTTESDGTNSPARVIDMYKGADYGVLALTDHDKYTWPWTQFGRDPDELGMVAIPGNELSKKHHMLSLFSDYKANSYTLDEALEGIRRRNGLAAMCHPGQEWKAMFAVQSLEVPLVPELRRATRGDFTIETWFRTTKSGRNILMGNFATNYAGALNLELNYENRIRVFMYPTAGNGPPVDVMVTADTSLQINTRDGLWHHLAASRTGSNLVLYLDGHLAAQASNAGASFDLQGPVYYISRDTRLDRLDFTGNLDLPRLWLRALTSNEVHQLAMGGLPGEPGQPTREGILFEYGFELRNGSPVQTGQTERVQADDGGGHPAGPFHALPGFAGGGMYSDQVPPGLVGRSAHSMRFDSQVSFTNIPPVVLDWYADLYRRHPHLFAIEIVNPWQDNTLDHKLWDLLLDRFMPARPIWGTGVDDMHFGGTDFLCSWVNLLTDDLTPGGVKSALANGRFYVIRDTKSPTNWRTVPRVSEVVHDPQAGILTLRATRQGQPVAESTVRWISGGQVVHVGSALPYRQTPGISRYVRAEIIDAQGRAYLNPFGFATGLTVAGLKAEDKIYDGTVDASVVGTPFLVDPPASKDVRLAGEPTFAFSSANAGDAVPVVISGLFLAGSDASQYELRHPSLQATIHQADQSITFAPVSTSYVGEKIELAATASSGLPVLFGLERGRGSIDPLNHTAMFTGIGMATLVASQRGNNNWNPATDVAHPFLVTKKTLRPTPLIWQAETSSNGFFVAQAEVPTPDGEMDLVVQASDHFRHEDQAFVFQDLVNEQDYTIENGILTLLPTDNASSRIFRIGFRNRNNPETPSNSTTRLSSFNTTRIPVFP